MKIHLSGIKSYQLDLGIECKAFSDPRLEQTIQGIKRDHNEPRSRPRTPLTRPHLLRILTSIGHNNYESTVIRAAFTLAFAAFLRVGEFTYKEADKDLGGTFSKWFLTKSCIRLSRTRDYLELNLPSSKTDPFREGIKLTIAASYDNGCPVRAMRVFLANDTHRPQSAPLFRIGKETQLAFSREYVFRTLQQQAIAAGLDQGNWNGHSFRRGAATWAAEVGIPENEIQTLGRWRSDAYKVYIEYL